MNMSLKRASITQFNTLFSEELNRGRGNQLLKGPSSGKPSALPKSRFPGLIGHVTGVKDSCRDIGKVNVALRGIPIPPKHGVDRFLKLSATRLVDTASIDPKVLQAIALSLLPTEANLVVTSLALAGTMHQVFVGNLFTFRTPGVRKYSISRYIIADVIVEQDDLASAIQRQKTHCIRDD
jgi:hypothetical protein